MSANIPATVIERVLSEVMFNELKKRGFDERLIRSMLNKHADVSALLSEIAVGQTDLKEKE